MQAQIQPSFLVRREIILAAFLLLFQFPDFVLQPILEILQQVRAIDRVTVAAFSCVPRCGLCRQISIVVVGAQFASLSGLSFATSYFLSTQKGSRLLDFRQECRPTMGLA